MYFLYLDRMLRIFSSCLFMFSLCAIVIPWNYPLMMLAWKTAACLAAGNTVVLKPAQVKKNGVNVKHAQGIFIPNNVWNRNEAVCFCVEF